MSAVDFAVRFLLAPLGAAAVVALAVFSSRGRGERPSFPQRFDPAGVAVLAGLVVADLLQRDPVGGGVELFLAPVGLLCLGLWVSSYLRRPWLVLVPCVVVVAGLMPAFGVVVEDVKLPFSTTFVSTGAAAYAVTVIGVLLAVWAFMSLRDAPAVPLGVGGIAALGFLAACLLEPEITPERARVLSAVVAASCFGALLGWWPRRAGVGASGALVVGFLIGNVAVLGALRNTAFLIVILPLLLIGAPLVNATYAIAYGRRRGSTALAIETRSQRLHEILLAQGYTPTQVLRLFVLGAAYLTGVAVVLVALITLHFTIKLLILGVALLAGALLVYFAAKMMPHRRLPRQPDGKVRAWNVAISPVRMEEAIEAIDDYIRTRAPHQIVTADASAIVRAQEDREFGDILNEASMVAADGAGVVWMARMLDLPIDERVSGCDMVLRICERAAERGYAVYLLGGEPGVADEAAAELTGRFPRLRIAGTQHGYFGPEEEPEILAGIRAERPEVLFVALGIPKQEKWIRQHLDEVGVPVCIGVGGSLDVIAGRVKRAPAWMQRAGLEWLWRTVLQPRRLPRLLALPRFALMTLRAALRREDGKSV